MKLKDAIAVILASLSFLAYWVYQIIKSLNDKKRYQAKSEERAREILEKSKEEIKEKSLPDLVDESNAEYGDSGETDDSKKG